MRTSVYVDGFNRYYGLFRRRPPLTPPPPKWLDLRKLCELLLPKHEIQRIRYFTALIEERGENQAQRRNQQAYLTALRTVAGLTIHYGHFRTRKRWSRLVSPPADGPDTVRVYRTEEKASDVNLATFLVSDGYEGDYEAAAVVSADSDLEQPIELVRRKLGLPIYLITPQKHVPVQLRRAVSGIRRIRAGVCSQCELPSPIKSPHGLLTKPAGW